MIYSKGVLVHFKINGDSYYNAKNEVLKAYTVYTEKAYKNQNWSIIAPTELTTWK